MCPMLAARVKERNNAPCLWVAGVGFGVFVAVARWTRPSQFGQSIARATHTRHDVFTNERCTRMAGRMLTILAAVPSAVTHLPPHGARDGLTRFLLHSSNRSPA